FSHVRTPSPDDWPTADLSTVDVASGEVKTLLNLPAAESSPLFSPDGQSIAFTLSDDPPTWAGSRHVCVIPSGGGIVKQRAETKGGFGRYSELVGWANEGDRIFLTEVQGTSMKLLAMPLDGPPKEINSNRGISLGGVSLSSSRIFFGFGWESLAQPSEA